MTHATNTDGLKPVCESEVMARMNDKLNGAGFWMSFSKTWCGPSEKPTSCSAELYLGNGFVGSFRCVDTLADQMGVLAEDEYLCWSEEAEVNAAPSKPVTPLETARRVNAAIKATGNRLVIHEAGYLELWSGKRLVTANVCLDGMAIDHKVLADDEFLCWPEEEAKAA